MFICTHCDAQFQKWSGKCFECQTWGTLIEETVAPTTRRPSTATALKPVALSEITGQNEHARFETKEPELDRVMGGGIVKGSLVLLSGEPGIGKSTLVADMAKRFIQQELNVLYISGEESAGQLKARFVRLNTKLDHLYFLESGTIEALVKTIEKQQPDVVIIDSVQTLFSEQVEGSPGSPTLVRYATSLLMELAKRTGVAIMLIGQVTKDGAIAGPKTLEHMVDVVLNLDGDRVHPFRWLSASKNRFGATDEVGVFEMTSGGLVPVVNPSARFLEERVAVPGSVIAATIEGSRVFLVEVQALVEKSAYATPVRRASGFDQNRLQMLIAILSKRANLRLGEQDVYVNVIGGMKLSEPAADLSICAAIVSAAKNQTYEKPTVFFGEVGLGGEIRRVPMMEKRAQEANRLGVQGVCGPETHKTVADL
ncbi:DNA repair protein RadA [Candidatus Uhrbacteria bacterium]|nr:DNA repair protein RadA [Candidatus Uhrbacteria bacterium]